MDGASKLALAVVLSAVLVVVSVIGYKEFDRHRTVRELNEGIQQFTDEMDAQARESAAQAQAAERARSMRAAQESARYDLAPNQRCVGGAVVQVEGSSYTQVGSLSYPIHCSGRRADKPLR